MSDLIFHATFADFELIRTWINDSPDVAWIVKSGEQQRRYKWKAQSRIDRVDAGDYALWHIASGPLNIPSGSLLIADAVVVDPFVGWEQDLARDGATSPWFGANLPGPYHVSFRQRGKEKPNALGRSDFLWALDRYKSIGKPAHPEAKAWWARLRKFLTKEAAEVRPWGSKPTLKQDIFPEALAQEREGRHLDINP